MTTDLIGELASYIVAARRTPLPDEVAEKTSLHVLDTLAAIVSGAVMPPGEAGARLVAAAPSGDDATVIGTSLRADVTRAALANGMSAHADETDDSHEPSLTHPGCAIVPAALAVAEREDRSGAEFLAAVALGYDVGTRVTRALWSDNGVLRTQPHSTHAIGGLFGAAAASATLLDLDEQEVRYVLSYTSQEASGTRSWTRDVEHIEKAYVFAGMPASTGVWVTQLVAAGWPGVRDVLRGTYDLFASFGVDPEPDVLVADLGSRYEIVGTNIKRYCVGSPIQAPLDALLDIVHTESIAVDQVASASVRLPAGLVRVVDDREMPNINLQYLAAVALEDGDVTFTAAHDDERFARWRRDGAKLDVEVVRDEEMAAVRQAVATIRLVDGREFEKHVTAVRGTAGNPMTRDEVEHKARDLVHDLLTDGGDGLLERSRELVGLDRVRTLLAALAG